MFQVGIDENFGNSKIFIYLDFGYVITMDLFTRFEMHYSTVCERIQVLVILYNNIISIRCPK